MSKFFFIFLFLFILVFPSLTFARTTPEDIVNEQKQILNQRLKNYSPANQKKVQNLFQLVLDFNQQKTHQLELIAKRQGEILDEYVLRNNINENGGADGINRSNDPVAVARIEITRAHEAIAYQAAKNYIPNLNGEANIKSDFLNLISSMQYDMGIPINKLKYSETLLKNLIDE